MATATAPFELRQYCRLITLSDVKNDVRGVWLPTGPTVEGYTPSDLFMAPILQYRYKFKNGQTVEWSDWLDVPLVKEETETAAEST